VLGRPAGQASRRRTVVRFAAVAVIVVPAPEKCGNGRGGESFGTQQYGRVPVAGRRSAGRVRAASGHGLCGFRVFRARGSHGPGGQADVSDRDERQRLAGDRRRGGRRQIQRTADGGRPLSGGQERTADCRAERHRAVSDPVPGVRRQNGV